VNIVLDKENMTCLITDSAENPTKHCFINNWHPIEHRTFANSVELQRFAESIANNPNIYSPMPTDEPVAEEPAS